MRTDPSAWQCATILEFGKHVLDFVPVFLQCLVVTDAAGTIGTGRDEGNDPLRLQRVFELISTLCTISQSRVRWGHVTYQRLRPLISADLTCD